MENTTDNNKDKTEKTFIEQEEKHQQDEVKPVTVTGTNNDSGEAVEQQGSLKNSK
jgi:hypothetical protein